MPLDAEINSLVLALMQINPMYSSVRTTHVVPAVANEASGPSYSVPRLCESLIDLGIATRLVSLDWSKDKRELAYGLTFPMGIGPRALGRSPAMLKWLNAESSAGRVDIIHNHSLWMMPNVYAGLACKDSQTQLVVSPRGTMSKWSLAQRWVAKRIFWKMLQGRSLAQASCFHATCAAECEEIRALGFRQPVAIIPNGIDLPKPFEGRPSPRQRLLYLSRIHPKKGLDTLLAAWEVVSPDFVDWELEIVGPLDSEFANRMQTLVIERGLARVRFAGEKNGQDKWAAFASAQLYVLPTHSENFGMTIAEALASRVPVITTTGAPWRELDSRGAGWSIEIGLDPLVSALRGAMRLDPRILSRMGETGRLWMARDFSWESVADRFAKTYSWLRIGGQKPECVRSD